VIISFLVILLGRCDLLMVQEGSWVNVLIGVGSAFALFAAVALRRSIRVAGLLLAVGTIPFAVVAWTALVPIVVLLVVAALARPLLKA
jgi:hypothetical protein